MNYTWIPFYKEFSQKLLKYKDNRMPLINWIYDNIDGRRNNRHVEHSSYSISPLKVMPLAALIALSPLTVTYAQNNNSKVLNQKIYSEVLKDQIEKNMDLRVEYIDSDGDYSTVESVHFSKDKTVNKMMNGEPMGVYDIYGGVKSLTDYRFNVIGDDGKSLGTIVYSQLILSDGHEISLGNIVEDMRNFSSSSKNNAFKVKKVDVDLVPGLDASLQAKHVSKFDTSWVQQTRNKYYDFGKKILSGDLKTSQGNYKMSFYSKDGDNGNFETVVVERDDGLRFKLDGITQLELMFATADGNKEEKISLGMINVSWPNLGEHAIFDNELFNEIFRLTQDSKFNNAFSASIIDKKVTVTQSGILSTLSQEKKSCKVH